MFRSVSRERKPYLAFICDRLTARRPRPPRARTEPPQFEALEPRRLLSVFVTIDYTLDTENFFDIQAKKDLSSRWRMMSPVV